jgi:hypothetical protein
VIVIEEIGHFARFCVAVVLAQLGELAAVEVDPPELACC